MVLTDLSVTQTIVYLCYGVDIFMRYTIRPLFTCYGIDIFMRYTIRQFTCYGIDRFISYTDHCLPVLCYWHIHEVHN